MREHTTATRLRWVLAVLGLVTASCGSGTTAEERADREQMLTVMRQEIIEALPNASPTQQQILADLHVSPGEADKAAAEVVDCAKAQGVTVTPLPETGGMSFETILGTTQSSEEHIDAVMKISDDCYNALFWLTANALALQNTLSSDEIERRNALVLDCLVAAGFEVGSWPNVQSEPDPAIEADCVDSAMSQLNQS